MAIPFLQALHYKKATRRSVDLVVIHSAEIGESLDGAEALMRVCAAGRRNADGSPIVSSWHYAVDADSVTQSVREEDIAFHAPGVNPRSIGIELTGRARQSAAEWDDQFSRRMLERASILVARICARWEIPTQYVPAAKLVQAVRGITTHHDVSRAFKKSDHWDPGPGFPMPTFVAAVQAVPPSESTPPRREFPELRRGARGDEVIYLQQLLNKSGHVPPLDPDGDFGGKTQAAVVLFQRRANLQTRSRTSVALVPNGVVDEATWRELLA